MKFHGNFFRNYHSQLPIVFIPHCPPNYYGGQFFYFHTTTNSRNFINCLYRFQQPLQTPCQEIFNRNATAAHNKRQLRLEFLFKQ